MEQDIHTFIIVKMSRIDIKSKKETQKIQYTNRNK